MNRYIDSDFLISVVLDEGKFSDKFLRSMIKGTENKEVLDKVARSDNGYMHIFPLLTNRNVSPETLDWLSMRATERGHILNNWAVKASIAEHPNAGESALRRLLHDEDPGARVLARSALERRDRAR